MRGLVAETGGEVVAVQGDVQRAEDCIRIVDETVARFGGLDILVNNDGAPPLGSFIDFDDHAWSRAVDQNLRSVVRCIRVSGQSEPYLSPGFQCEGGSWLWCPRAEGKGS